MTTLEKVVPQLRFPGFKVPWKPIALGGTVQSIEAGWSPQCAAEPAEDSEWGILKTTSVSWQGYNDLANKRLLPGFAPRKEIEVKERDILITRAGPSERVGVVAHVDRTRPMLMLSDKIIRLRCNAESDSNFIARCLGSSEAQEHLLGRKSGLAKSQTNISQKDLMGISLTIPTLPEQRRIADFLTTVDMRLQQLSKKRTLLEGYKMGVMQQLFTQALRFKDDDGNQFAEWEEKKLGEVSTFLNGRAYKQDELLNEGPCPVLRVGNFFTNPDWYYSDLELPEDKYCDTGDLLYAWSASFGPRIWRGGKVIYHYHIWKVLPSSQITKFFLFHLLDWDVKRIKNAHGNGITMMHVTKQAMEERPFSLPCAEEQTKIANFLTALDRKIESVSSQITHTQVFKKGLLQQMFV